MTELSHCQNEIARKNERAILHALAAVSQKAVCDAVGLSETKISRLKDGSLEQYCAALAFMGLKIVPIDVVTVTRAERRFMAEQMVKHYQAIVDEEKNE